MRLILPFLILILAFTTLWSQNSEIQKNQQGIYGEIVNVPFFIIPVPKGFGLGYEYHFNKKPQKTNARLGLEYKKLDGNYYNLSSEYNFLFGKTKHFLETGGIFQLGYFKNKSRTFSGEVFEVKTIFARAGAKVGYLSKLGSHRNLLLRISIHLLSKDLQIKVLENDFINKPGEGDQWIQPHIYIGVTKFF